MPKKGFLIALEGIDGSGLTTQAELLRDWFRTRSLRVALTKEPSLGPIGALIRLALNHRLVGLKEQAYTGSPDNYYAPIKLPEDIMALMFAADRLDHCYTEIRPQIEKGTHVICDRYILSSLAYQTLDKKISLSWLQQINSHADRPDVTIFLDVPVAVCRQRIERQRWQDDRYEGADTLSVVRSNYFMLIAELQKSKKHHIVVIDGDRAIDSVHQDIVQVITALNASSRSLGQGELLGERWITSTE